MCSCARRVYGMCLRAFYIVVRVTVAHNMFAASKLTFLCSLGEPPPHILKEYTSSLQKLTSSARYSFSKHMLYQGKQLGLRAAPCPLQEAGLAARAKQGMTAATVDAAFEGVLAARDSDDAALAALWSGWASAWFRRWPTIGLSHSRSAAINVSSLA